MVRKKNNKRNSLYIILFLIILVVGVYFSSQLTFIDGITGISAGEYTDGKIYFNNN